MIKNLFERGLEQAKNYDTNDTRKLTNKELRHLYAVTNWRYILCYGLLENIMFAIRRKECNSADEIEKFISERLDKIQNLEERIPITLENDEDK